MLREDFLDGWMGAGDGLASREGTHPFWDGNTEIQRGCAPSHQLRALNLQETLAQAAKQTSPSLPSLASFATQLQSLNELPYR